MKIDFVSDVVCPWCAIGLQALEQALERVAGTVQAELHIQPFELNPQMPPGGVDARDYLLAKTGMSAEQLAANSEAIRQRGAALGFTFNFGPGRRLYNSFDAHRLLHWAGLQAGDHQRRLKQALLVAYFSDNRDPGDAQVLADAAAAAGLDRAQAAAVVADGRYGDEVRAAEQFYQSHGIHSVPAVIIDDRHLISGGQPVEVFEQALRQIAAAAG